MRVDGYEAATEERRLGGDVRRHGAAVSTTLPRWSTEVFDFHTAGRVTSAGAEGVNNCVDVLERKAYGVPRAVNPLAS